MTTPSLDTTYGAMLIGLLFATFFQGVLSVQAYVYYESFPNDSWRTKSLVAGVWCMDFAHLVLISQATYHYLVTNWGNTTALIFSTWELDLHLAFVGIATIMCQFFFLHRIWMFGNKNKPLVSVLACLCLTTFGMDIAIATHNIQHPVVASFSAWTPEVVALFSIGAGTDVIMALLLCYYIQRGRSGFEKTDSVIALVMRYTITTGLATSILAIACVIAYFASPDTFVFIAMHFSLGRLYTNALLATLNSRRMLRLTADQRRVQRGPPAKLIGASFGSGSRSLSNDHKTGNMSVQLDTNEQGVIIRSHECSHSDKRVLEDNIELGAVHDGFKFPSAV